MAIFNLKSKSSNYTVSSPDDFSTEKGSIFSKIRAKLKLIFDFTEFKLSAVLNQLGYYEVLSSLDFSSYIKGLFIELSVNQDNISVNDTAINTLHLHNIDDKLGLEYHAPLTKIVDGSVVLLYPRDLMAGNSYYFVYDALSNSYKSSTITLNSGSALITTSDPHGFSIGDRITFSYSSTLPSEIIKDTIYFIVSNNFSSTQFRISDYPASKSLVCSIDMGSHAIIHIPNHGLKEYSQVVFSTTGTLPTGITAGTTYYIAQPKTDSFYISTDIAGNSLIDISSPGTGSHTTTIGTPIIIASGGSASVSGLSWIMTNSRALSINNPSSFLTFSLKLIANISSLNSLVVRVNNITNIVAVYLKKATPSLNIYSGNNIMYAIPRFWKTIMEYGLKIINPKTTMLGSPKWVLDSIPWTYLSNNKFTVAGNRATSSGANNLTRDVYIKLTQNSNVSTKVLSSSYAYKGDIIYCEINVASPAIISATNHGLVENDIVIFSTDGVLPTGILKGAIYYVVTDTADTFKISTTIDAGNIINTTASGSGIHNVAKSINLTTVTLEKPVLINDTINSTYYAIEFEKLKITKSVFKLLSDFITTKLVEMEISNSGTCTFTSTSPIVVTRNTHGFNKGEQVFFTTTDSLPTGILADKIYYILSTDFGQNSFKITSSYQNCKISKLSPSSPSSPALIRAKITNSDICTISKSTPALISRTGHGFSIGDPVVFSTYGELPTGLTERTLYYVISEGKTNDAFEVSETLGGSAISTTTFGSGIHFVAKQTAHGLVADNSIMFDSTEDLPTGISKSTIYYVLSTDFNAYQFKISTSVGGSITNITDERNGLQTLILNNSAVTASTSGSGTHTVSGTKGIIT